MAMDKPRSRYQVIEKGGRLVVLVDGQPVDGIASRSGNQPRSLQNPNTVGPSTRPSSLPVAMTPTATPTPHNSPLTSRPRPSLSSPIAIGPLVWFDRLGQFGMSALGKGRSDRGQLLIRRTIKHKPHQAELSAEEEAKLARAFGIWLALLFLLVITLPVKFTVNAILIFILFRVGWPIVFKSIPQDRWQPI